MKADCYLKNGQYVIELTCEDEADNEFIIDWHQTSPEISDQVYYSRNSKYNSITLTKDN